MKKVTIQLTPFDLLEICSMVREYMELLEDDSVIQPIFQNLMSEASKMTLEQIEDAHAERQMNILCWDIKKKTP